MRLTVRTGARGRRSEHSSRAKGREETYQQWIAQVDVRDDAHRSPKENLRWQEPHRGSEAVASSVRGCPDRALEVWATATRPPVAPGARAVRAGRSLGVPSGTLFGRASQCAGNSPSNGHHGPRERSVAARPVLMPVGLTTSMPPAPPGAIRRSPPATAVLGDDAFEELKRTPRLSVKAEVCAGDLEPRTSGVARF